MNPKNYSQMMSYLTRPAMARGGRIGFDSGGEALRRKYLQQDYKKYGKDKLEKATQKMLSLGEEDFIKPGRTIPKLDAPSLKDVKNYEDLDSQLKRKIKTKLDKYDEYVGEAEARILGRKDKTLTDKKTLPDSGAKIVKEGDRIVDINFADPEIKKQFLEDFDRRYKGSRMTAKQRGVDNASLYKKYLSNLSPKTAELALAGLAKSKNKMYEVRPYGFYDAQTNIKRNERLDKAAKKAGEGVADINKEQKKVVRLLNEYYKNNPEELLKNTKLKNILDLTLEDGNIVKKNKYVKDEDFLELIKNKKGGLFNIDHVDEVQFEKLSTEFPVFKQLATYNTNSGLIRSMKSYISKNQNSKDPIIQNKIKKQIEFLEDLKLRIDTPTGRVGTKEVLAAVDRKAGVLPNFLAQLKALNIKLPGKAKVALLSIGGLGATTLAQAEEVSGAKAGTTGFTTGEKLAGAGAGVGAYAARKPIIKGIKTAGRVAGKALAPLAVPLEAGFVLSDLKSGASTPEALANIVLAGGLVTAKEKRDYIINKYGEDVYSQLQAYKSYGEDGMDLPQELPDNFKAIQAEADQYVLDLKQQRAAEFERKSNLPRPEIDPFQAAKGGRVGFDEGSKPKSPGRRAFLKGITALAALPIVGKYFKLGKVLERAQPYTGPAIEKIKGMPEWFPSLVKKLYTEGEDVTKQVAYKERMVVKRGTLEGGDDVDMIYDMDTGDVSIDVTPKKGKYETSSGAYNKEYSLDYKKGQQIEEGKLAGKTEADDFGVREIEGRMDQQAMDVDWDVNETTVDEAMSDLTELEAFAKNKSTKQIYKKKGTKPKDVFPDYDPGDYDID